MKRLFSMVLVIVMTASVFCASFTFASADSTTGSNNSIKTDIAFAFDDSGSMFGDIDGGRVRWCYAKYATEVFASMVVDKGKSDCALHLYPFGGKATTGGEEIDNDEGLEINGIEGLNKLRELKIEEASGTYFSAVERAKDKLAESKAANKWLVILCDGEFFDEDDSSMDDSWTAKLNKYEDEGINVKFIGFGEADSAKGLDKDKYEICGNEKELKDKLIKTCNEIFRRKSVKIAKDGTVNFDFTVKKLVLFSTTESDIDPIVQADDSGAGKSIEASVNKDKKKPVEGSVIKSSAVVTIRPNTKMCADPTFREMAIEAYNKSKDAKKLYAKVIVYDGLKKGKYNIKNYSKHLKVYYQPDVRIEPYLVSKDDPKGTPLEFKEGLTLPAGKYIIKYRIIDADGTVITDEANKDLYQKLGWKEEAIGYKDKDGKFYRGSEINVTSGEINIVIKGKIMGEYELSIDGDSQYSATVVNYDFEIIYPRNSKKGNYMYWLHGIIPGIDGIVPSIMWKFNHNFRNHPVYKDTKYKEWLPFEIIVKLNGNKLSIEEVTKLYDEGHLKFDITGDKYKFNVSPENGKLMGYLEPVGKKAELGEFYISSKLDLCYPAKVRTDKIEVSKEIGAINHDIVCIYLRSFGIDALVILILVIVILFLFVIPIFPGKVYQIYKVKDQKEFEKKSQKLKNYTNMASLVADISYIDINALSIIPLEKEKNIFKRIFGKITYKKNFEMECNSGFLKGRGLLGRWFGCRKITFKVRVDNGEKLYEGNKSIGKALNAKGNEVKISIDDIETKSYTYKTDDNKPVIFKIKFSKFL